MKNIETVVIEPVLKNKWSTVKLEIQKVGNEIHNRWKMQIGQTPFESRSQFLKYRCFPYFYILKIDYKTYVSILSVCTSPYPPSFKCGVAALLTSTKKNTLEHHCWSLRVWSDGLTWITATLVSFVYKPYSPLLAPPACEVGAAGAPFWLEGALFRLDS